MFSPRIHRYIFLFGLIALGAGMLFGTVPTSIPEFILFGNWMLEGRFSEKWKQIKSNKLLWLLCSIYILHLLGLIHTSDMSKGLDDVRIKVPLLILPLVFFTSPVINKKELQVLLVMYVWAVILSSLWCMVYYYTHDLMDVRKASRFMSHIRFGLFINLCIGILFYLFYEFKQLVVKVAIIAAVIYLLLVMLVLGMVTGLVLFGLICFGFIVYSLFNQKAIYKVAGVVVVSIVAIVAVVFVKSEWNDFNYVDTSEKNMRKEKSLSGRPYFKVDTTNFHTENGFYIANNIQYDELAMEWHKRSKSNLYSSDKKGVLVAWNVIRYLSSKGLTKDSAGIAALTKEDIENIEKGITNYKYADASPVRTRLKEFFWEYRDYKQGFNPSGNTLLMRLEFWKSAIYIIKRNVWIGVGTGDAQRAFDKSYYRTNTKLSHEWRLRSHNQFLAITVAFGVTGLLLFLIFLIYPAITLRKELMNLYWLFFAIATISFLTEDTLETQSGVSFFAYFNSLFLWMAFHEKQKKQAD